MNKYICRYGLYHDKPMRLDNNPSSNNGWIYTAYGQKLGHRYGLIAETFEKCKLDENASRLYFISRLPDKLYPPISRDEILGLVSLGFDPLEYGWAMYREIHKPNYWLAIKTLWKIRKEHRNTVWEQSHVEGFCIAFKLWFHDRYYINKMQNKCNFKPTNLFYMCMFQIYALSTILQSNISATNVLTLQLEDMNSKFWIRFIDKKANYLEYFGKDHIFNK